MGAVTTPPAPIVQVIKDAAGLQDDNPAHWPAIAKVVHHRAAQRGDTRFITHAELLALQHHKERTTP